LYVRAVADTNGERHARRLQESIENFMVAVWLINCSDGQVDAVEIWLYRESRNLKGA